MPRAPGGPPSAGRSTPYAVTFGVLVAPVAMLAGMSAQGSLIGLFFATMLAALFAAGLNFYALRLALGGGARRAAWFTFLWPWVSIGAFWVAGRWERFCTDNCPVVPGTAPPSSGVLPLVRSSRHLPFGFSPSGGPRRPEGATRLRCVVIGPTDSVSKNNEIAAPEWLSEADRATINPCQARSFLIGLAWIPPCAGASRASAVTGSGSRCSLIFSLMG